MTLWELASQDIYDETYGYIFCKFFSLQTSFQYNFRPPIDTSNKDWTINATYYVWQDQTTRRRAFISANDSFCYRQLRQPFPRNIVSVMRCCCRFLLVRKHCTEPGGWKSSTQKQKIFALLLEPIYFSPHCIFCRFTWLTQTNLYNDEPLILSLQQAGILRSVFVSRPRPGQSTHSPLSRAVYFLPHPATSRCNEEHDYELCIVNYVTAWWDQSVFKPASTDPLLHEACLQAGVLQCHNEMHHAKFFSKYY
jgi:hypothetical protein